MPDVSSGVPVLLPMLTIPEARRETGTDGDPEAGRRPETVVPPAHGGLGSTAVRGAGWVLAFSLVGKALVLGSQLVLAFYLAPEAFGLAAMATAAASATAVLGAANFIALLVQRQDRFEEEAGQVFWMALVSGLAAAVALAVAAPAVATAFGEPAVAPLIRILALAIPFQALTTVYAAELLRSLRFRTLIAAQFGMNVVQQGLTVWLALNGWGATAIVIPVVAAAAVGLVAQRVVAGSVALERPHPRTWGRLVVPALWLFAVTAAQAALPHVSNIVIGLFRDADVVGYYFWGYMLAAQVVLLLTDKLRDVLFPTLARLNTEPARQRRAFHDVVNVLLLAAAPLCAAQAVAAGPIVTLAFGDRWLPAIPVVQALSMAMVVQPFIALTSALLLARGEYARLTMITAANLVVMGVATGLGAMVGTQGAIAIGAGTGFVLVGLVYGAVGFHAVGSRARDVMPALGRVLVLGGISLAASVAFTLAVPGSSLAQAVVGPLIAVSVYAVAARLLFPDSVLPVVGRVRGLILSVLRSS